MVMFIKPSSKKGKTKEPKKPLDGYVALLKAKSLLKKERIQLSIGQLPTLLNMDELQFDNHVLTLIHRFAEFVQQLPETQNSYFSQLGGTLEHGLHRAVLSAKMCRSHFLEEETRDALTSKEMLWAYAAFSAGLLHDIGKIVVDLKVVIYDRYLDAHREWIPWEGSMLGAGTDYKFEFVPFNQDPFRRRLTLLLARQLMPTQSFLWIASDPIIFNAWLAMLEDDYRASELIGEIVPIADAEIILAELLNDANEKIAKDKKDKRELLKFSELITTFSKPKEDSLLLTDRNLAKIFLNWLHDKIKNSEITPNRVPDGVIRVNEGVLLTQALFQKFISEAPNKEIKMMQANQILHALAQTGLSEMTADKQALQQYSARDQANFLIKGLVVTNVNLIFPYSVPPEVHQNFVKVPAAVLGIHPPAQMPVKIEAMKAEVGKGETPQTPTPPIKPMSSS